MKFKDNMNLQKKFLNSIQYLFVVFSAQKRPVRLCEPLIGTSNFGTTKPQGPIAVRGMVSVSLQRGRAKNLPLKRIVDGLSTPYVQEKHFFNRI